MIVPIRTLISSDVPAPPIIVVLSLSTVIFSDVYTDDTQLGEGKSSLSIAIYFINQEKTFDDKTIDGLMQKIMTTLQEKVNAIIRK